MKLSLEFLIFLLGVLLPATLITGLAVPSEEKPIRFLVLQRSDVLDDEPVVSDDVKPTGSATIKESDESDTTTDLPLNDEVKVNDPVVSENSKEKIWNPADGWRELNFTVVPEGEGEFHSNTKIGSSGTAPFPIIEKINEIQQRVSCRCGVPKVRVVNGIPARINDIPWTAALVRNGFFGFGASKKPYCGATLINNLYIVTASHCVDGMFAGGLKVWLNEEDFLIDSETTGRQEYLVDEIIMNKNYDRRTVNEDIALLKLSKPVSIGNADTFMTPVCLPANNDADFAGLIATVSGWGVTSEGGSQANVLQKVDVPIMSNVVCNSDQTKYKGKISENMLCAGLMEGGKDSCQGDSGGPLIIDNNGRKTLIGIVSWGIGCAQAKSPGVYTRVARYPKWILDNTKDAQWCTE